MRRTHLTLTLAALALALAPAAQGQVDDLTGEEFHANSRGDQFDQPGDVTVTSPSCNPAGQSHLNGTASGPATGPYIGTFIANFEFGFQPGVVTAPPNTFSERFSIQALNGDEVRGVKSNPEFVSGRCFVESESGALNTGGNVIARYVAVIRTAEGTFLDRGRASVTASDHVIFVPVSGEFVTNRDFNQLFLIDTTPLVPFTKQDCNHNGFEGIFASKKECKDFVKDNRP